MKVLVIKEEGENNVAGLQSYVGTPYTNELQAKQAAIADFYATHHIKEEHSMHVYYFNNETVLRFISEETGEIFCEYFLLFVFF